MLLKPPLLEAIAARLATELPDDDRVAPRYKASPHSVPSSRNFNQFQGLYAEFRLRAQLEEICAPFGARIVFDPIEPHTHTGRYLFRPSNHNIAVYKLKTGETLCEYDQVLLVDDVPVVFELKLARDKNGSGKRGRNGRAHRLAHHLSPSGVRRLIAPVQEYFGQEACGLVYITYDENIKPDSAPQQRFLGRNGLLVPYPRHRDEHFQDMAHVILKHGL